MKARLTDQGVMIITPESGAESYALRHWSEQVVNERDRECVLCKFDYSDAEGYEDVSDALS